MGGSALAMVRQTTDSYFVLLATQRNLLALNLASLRKFQDHQCDILR